MFLFLTEESYSHDGPWTRELGQPLAWVTNVLTNPDLNIEFSTSSTRTDP